MRHLNIAALAFAALVSQFASAAAIAPSSAENPRGLYVGLNLGDAINQSSFSLNPSGCFTAGAGCGTGGLAGNPARTDSGHFSQSSVIVGAQAGYDWPLARRWTVGAVTNIDIGSSRGSVSQSQALGPPLFASGSFNHTVTQKLEYFGTLRAKFGLEVAPTWRVYGTAGIAFGSVKSDTTSIFPPPGASDTYNGSVRSSRSGWTVGTGVQDALSSRLSLFAEYLYVDLGSFTYTDACGGISACSALTPPPSYATTVKTREHLITLGANFRFPARK